MNQSYIRYAIKRTNRYKENLREIKIEDSRRHCIRSHSTWMLQRIFYNLTL